MIVHHSATGLRLDEPQDFRHFKVVLSGTDQPAAEAAGLRFADADNALVPVALVPALPGAPADAAWAEGYRAMVASAAKYGWIDEPSQSIRAHVEREP